MAGYKNDFSMSNNAAAAYSSGLKPYSKWTKADILDAITDEYEEDGAALIDHIKKENYPLAFLKFWMLEIKEWHHTSCRYNCTYFHGLSYASTCDLVEDPEKTREFFETWKKDHDAEQAKKQAEKDAKLTHGILHFREWSGSRRWGKYVWLTREGYGRQEGEWLVLYNGRGKNKSVIMRKKIDGCAQPRLEKTPVKRASVSA